MIRLLDTVDLPEYAICYLEYGEYGDLTKEEIDDIESFLAGYEGYSITFEYGEERFFIHSPEFGPPCNCVELNIYGEKI